ncbi:hypothetical protein [Pseudoblastomonas halimionae]|uniref:Uncharacterized protein n=1 Tax=Alteriqipengyuania halimionae TaxID=1926630 RepID=A0A6I4U351_9SPHN|nr:hypothetical protein [Alteriqipengyuania halimionae]MXP08912.1 hypothetical protein [Alteriqipengyuania halimionae]
MGWPAAIVVIVSIIVIGKLMSSRYRAQAGIIEDERGNQTYVGQASRDPEAQREIEDLRERIKVLERIATDKNSEAERLASQIEDLRKD